LIASPTASMLGKRRSRHGWVTPPAAPFDPNADPNRSAFLMPFRVRRRARREYKPPVRSGVDNDLACVTEDHDLAASLNHVVTLFLGLVD